MQAKFSHTPVLLEEVVALLAPPIGGTILDVTVGLGGHAEQLLRVARGTLIAVDTDPESLRIAEERLAACPGSKRFLHANFRDLPSLGLPPADALIADLGVSSLHFDDPDRGFSIRFDAPLDLRLDRSRGVAASALVRELSAEDLAEMFREFGELRGARRLGSLVAAAAEQGKMERTGDLVSVAERAYGFRARTLLPQIFQAVRIAVNDELGASRALLAAGPPLLARGGRMAVIAYHSLEDRLVKRAFRSLAEPGKNPQTGAVERLPAFTLLTKRAVRPGPEEVAANLRSRSARLRVIQRAER